MTYDNNILNKCIKCDKVIEKNDIKNICLKCRGLIFNEIKQLMSQGKIDEAREIISSTPLDNKWKKNIFERIYPEYNQFVWRVNNEKRIKDEEKIEKQRKLQKIEEEKRELEIKKEEAKLNHEKRLNSLNIDYLGVSKSSIKSHRKTYCYACKKNLDNEIDDECNSCKWIICSCGACGCGYNK